MHAGHALLGAGDALRGPVGLRLGRRGGLLGAARAGLDLAGRVRRARGVRAGASAACSAWAASRSTAATASGDSSAPCPPSAGPRAAGRAKLGQLLAQGGRAARAPRRRARARRRPRAGAPRAGRACRRALRTATGAPRFARRPAPRASCAPSRARPEALLPLGLAADLGQLRRDRSSISPRGARCAEASSAREPLAELLAAARRRRSRARARARARAPRAAREASATAAAARRTAPLERGRAAPRVLRSQRCLELLDARSRLAQVGLASPCGLRLATRSRCSGRSPVVDRRRRRRTLARLGERGLELLHALARVAQLRLEPAALLARAALLRELGLERLHPLARRAQLGDGRRASPRAGRSGAAGSAVCPPGRARAARPARAWPRGQLGRARARRAPPRPARASRRARGGCRRARVPSSEMRAARLGDLAAGGLRLAARVLELGGLRPRARARGHRSGRARPRPRRRSGPPRRRPDRRLRVTVLVGLDRRGRQLDQRPEGDDRPGGKVLLVEARLAAHGGVRPSRRPCDGCAEAARGRCRAAPRSRAPRGSR